MIALPLAAAGWILWTSLANPTVITATQQPPAWWFPLDGFDTLTACRIAQQERERKKGPNPERVPVVNACFPEGFEPRFREPASKVDGR